MNDQLRILHLEDSSDDAELVRATLARAGMAAEWQRVDTRNDYIAALDRTAYSVILADFNLPSFDGMSALTIASHKCPEVPFIFVSGAIEEQLAIEALTSGATDYVFKSRLNRLAPVVTRALEETRLRRERREYEQALQQLINSTSALTGHAFFRTLARDLAAMLHTQYALIGLIADKDATRIRTVTLWAGGDYAENFEYALQGTPCENVAGKSECFYLRDVQRLFPQDRLLAEMALESYHGVPLFRSDGTPLGLLSVFDQKPMEDLVHLRPLVRVFASRAAAELERLETEQKLQEGQTAVRESGRRLATLMDNLRGMAYRCRNDPRWTMEFVSEGCEEMTGYAPADFIMNRKLAYADIIVPEDRQAVSDGVQRGIDAKTHFVLEYRITTAAGAVKWMWEQGCGVYDETGELIALEGLISDITERKRTETERTQLAAIVENSSDAIVSRALDGTILSWNAGAEHMLGYTAAQAIGQPLALILPPDRLKFVGPITERLHRGETIPDFETTRRHKDGHLIEVSASMAPLRNEAGEIIGSATIIRDISALKRAERELERKAGLTALLEALARAANEATTPEAALRVCLERICTYGHWSLGHAALYAPGQSSGMAQTSFWHGQGQERYDEVIRLTNGYAFNMRQGKFVGAALSDRKPVWVEDLESASQSGRIAAAFKSGLRTGFVFPVVVGDEIAAFLEFFAGEVRAPDTLLLEAIGSVASQLARLIERGRAEAARSQLAAIVEHSNDAITSRTFDGTIISWNAGAERMFGFSATEAIGKSISFNALPGRVPIFPNLTAKILSGEAVKPRNTQRLTKDGRVVDVLSSVSPIKNNAGEIVAIASIFQDTTALKRTEAARAQLATIVENSNDAIISRTLDGTITSWNAGAERLFGYTATETIGRPAVGIIVPPEARARASQNIGHIRLGERVAPYETRRITKDGRMIDVLSSVSPIRNSDGNITGAAIIFRDISALKQAEAARAQLATIVENSNDAIISRTLDGTIISWNAGAERMLGYTASEAIGQPVTLTLPPERAANIARHTEHILLGAVVAPHATQRTTKDGRVIDVLSSISPLKDSAGKITGAAIILHDISALKQAEAARRESEERFHAAFEQAGVGMGLRDFDPLKPRWMRVNQKLCDILGYTREEMLQMTAVDIALPEEREDALSHIQRLRRGEIKGYSREKRYMRKDGRIIWANLTIATVSGPDGRPTHIISVIQDITETKMAALALAASEEQFRQLATNIPEVFWIIDGATGAVSYVSPAFETIWGRTCEEFKANPGVWTDAVHPDDRERMTIDGEVVTRSGKKKDYRIMRPDGTIRWIHDRSFPVMENGRMQRIIGIAEDISDRKENESRLQHLAHYDSLTDLPNRVLFRDRLQLTLAQAQRNDWLIGVLLIGLDRFKNINDTYGHEVGDKVLGEASQRIAACTRLGDTAARLGGDEFGIILSNLGAAEDARLVAQKIMDSLARPLQIDGTETYLSASIGITLFPTDSKDADALIRDANAAIHRAKVLGRNNYQFYKTEMNARAKDKLGLENSLRHALDNNEFVLHYQPKVNLQAGEITGFEALLRWQRPGLGMVSPADFVPLLEETGLILPVGDWVLRTACAQARVWRDSGLGPVSIAVNLSVRQFLQRDLDQHLLQIINDAGIEPGLLELEITESFLMHNPEEAAGTLLKLKAAGIRISVDDFGTGYSSLSYLSRFPIDSVKIDRSFIRDVTQNPENAAITRAVIGLAHALGMKSVAEGVETETQLGFLSANDCDEIQGYFFSRPVPAAECNRMLEEDRRLTAHIRSHQPERFTVLLVDDEENVLQALERVLRRDGYRILTASSAAAGLDLLATHKVGVVISDERMPDMTGVAFLSRVYRMYPDTIRMLLTGYADMHATISAINDGAVYKFLLKPWDNNALRASVREAFRLYKLDQPGETDEVAMSDRVVA